MSRSGPRGTGSRRVGCIGLGAMGSPVAASLLAAGHHLVIHDLDPASGQPLLDAGATWAVSPASLAGQVEIVFTSLPGPAEVQAVALNPEGIVGGALPGLAWFDLSTNSPTVMRLLHAELAPRGIQVFDAPLSGEPHSAASGELTTWVGGDPDAFALFVPVLRAFAATPHLVGPIGAGSVAKLIHNASGYIIQTALAETFTLGVKAGVDPDALWDAVRTGTLGRHRTFDELSASFLPGRFDPPTATLDLARRDMSLACELGRELDVPLRLANLTLMEMTEAANRGWATRDAHSMMLLQEERAGVEVRISPERITAILQEAPPVNHPGEPPPRQSWLDRTVGRVRGRSHRHRTAGSGGGPSPSIPHPVALPSAPPVTPDEIAATPDEIAATPDEIAVGPGDTGGTAAAPGQTVDHPIARLRPPSVLDDNGDSLLDRLLPEPDEPVLEVLTPRPAPSPPAPVEPGKPPSILDTHPAPAPNGAGAGTGDEVHALATETLQLSFRPQPPRRPPPHPVVSAATITAEIEPGDLVSHPLLTDPPTDQPAAPGPRGWFYGWTVVGAVFVILMVTSGLGFYNAAVILRAAVTELDAPVGAISVGTALFFGVSGITGFLLARTMERIDLRWFYLAGGLLGATALYSLRWVDTLAQLYLFFAVFGMGFAMAGLVPGTTLVTRWFSARRSIAISIASTGLSLGGIALTPVSSSLIEDRGLGGAGPILAMVWLLGVIPIGLLLIRSRPSDKGIGPDGVPLAMTAANVPAAPAALPGATFVAARRSRFFILMCLTYALIFFSQVGGIAHLFNLAAERVDTATANLAISLLALTSVGGRLLGGLIVLKVPTKTLSLVLMVLQAMALSSIALSSTRISILASAVFFGISVGNLLMLQPLLLAEAYGVAEYSRIYSFNQLFSTIGVAGGPVVLGLVHDIASYEVSFILAGAASFLGFLAFMAAGPITRPLALWDRHPDPVPA